MSGFKPSRQFAITGHIGEDDTGLLNTAPPGSSQTKLSVSSYMDNNMAGVQTNCGPTKPILEASSFNQKRVEPRSDSSDTPIISLDNDLHGALVGGRYIPIDKQNELTSREKVLEVMVTATKSLSNINIQHVVDQIYQPRKTEDPVAKGEKRVTSRRKLFAILVMINKPKEILSFIKEDIWDDNLPFQRDQVLKIEAFENNTWKRFEVEAFYAYQWYFLSPVLELNSPKLIHYRFTERIPLPFISEITDINNSSGGGFGDVRKVQIHPAHYDSNVRYNAFITIRKLTSIAVRRCLSCCKMSSIWRKEGFRSRS